MKRVVSVSIFAFLLTFSMTISLPVRVLAERELSVHNINTGLDYATIQEAIDANETLEGHTIVVDEGTYHENVLMDKDNLRLIGENRDTTIVDGNRTHPVIHVTANNTVIKGFTVQSTGIGISERPGILLDHSFNSLVSDNNVTNNYLGIGLYDCYYCTVSDNYANANDAIGIYLLRCFNCSISNNNVKQNQYRGIWVLYSSNCSIWGSEVTDRHNYGIDLHNSFDCSICDNHIKNCNFDGIFLVRSFNNLIFRNDLTGNPQGIYVNGSGNKIFHNNLINYYEQAVIYGVGDNVWDDGYPSGGNYWSDYEGTDLDGDGIGDVPYVVDEDNQDNYPLMVPYVSVAEMRALYYDLLEKYEKLLDDFDSLSENYSQLLREFDAFNVNYLSMHLSFQQHLLDYAELKGNYTSLLRNYNNLQGYYNSLNSSYTELQEQYNSLNSTLKSGQEGIINELENVRTLMYVLIATTVIFIIATIYFIARPRILKVKERA